MANQADNPTVALAATTVTVPGPGTTKPSPTVMTLGNPGVNNLWVRLDGSAAAVPAVSGSTAPESIWLPPGASIDTPYQATLSAIAEVAAGILSIYVH